MFHLAVFQRRQIFLPAFDCLVGLLSAPLVAFTGLDISSAEVFYGFGSLLDSGPLSLFHGHLKNNLRALNNSYFIAFICFSWLAMGLNLADAYP